VSPIIHCGQEHRQQTDNELRLLLWKSMWLIMNFNRRLMITNGLRWKRCTFDWNGTARTAMSGLLITATVWHYHNFVILLVFYCSILTWMKLIGLPNNLLVNLNSLVLLLKYNGWCMIQLVTDMPLPHCDKISTRNQAVAGVADITADYLVISDCC